MRERPYSHALGGAQFKRCIDYFAFAIQSETRLAILFGARRRLLLPVCTENLNLGVVMVKSSEDGMRTNDSGLMNQTRNFCPPNLGLRTSLPTTVSARLVNTFDHFEAHNRPFTIARLAELLAGREAHRDDPGTPVSRCKTQPECRLFP